MANWVYQTLWTRPLTNEKTIHRLLQFTALSLLYAQHSGYKVRLHTDTRGAELVKDLPYDEVVLTLDEIPDTVPPQLFAAGKFYAMRKEGLHSVHIDLDVFLKQPVLDRFFADKRWDLVVQCDEYKEPYDHYLIHSRVMHILGYPPYCHPSWQHTYNVGTIGFHNQELFDKYVGNYFEALKLYTVEAFDKFKREYPEYAKEDWYLHFDYNLEQQTLHWLSLGHNVLTLVEALYANDCANAIGYTHLQGNSKWKTPDQFDIINRIAKFNPTLAQKLK